MADIRLFDRKIRVIVGTIEITDLDISFRIHKSLTPSPNAAELTILNLSAANRSALEHIQIVPVQIDVGYAKGMSTIFLGDLRVAMTTHEGPDYVTRLSAGDGEQAVRKARVNITIKPSAATNDSVLDAVARSLGVGIGNLEQAKNQLRASGLSNQFTEGAVLSGSAFREMNGICRTLGLSWSVLDGKLLILPLGVALAGQALLISENTGMIGSPTVDNSGVLTVKTLLIPDIFPGRKLVLESERISGQYRIEICDYSGDTAATDWYCTIQGKKY